jgi:hypothetical protein
MIHYVAALKRALDLIWVGEVSLDELETGVVEPSP